MDRKGWVAEGYPFDLKDGDALDRGRTSRFFTNVAVCMNCDIDPDQLQKWQDHFVYMRVYDDAIDRDASDVSEYIADPVVAGGLAIAEKRKTISDPRDLIASRQAEEVVYVAPLLLDTEPNQPGSSERERFNRWLEVCLKAADLFDSLVDLKEDFAAGEHQVAPNIKNRAILGVQTIKAVMLCAKSTPLSRFGDAMRLMKADTEPDFGQTTQQKQQRRQELAA